MLTVRRMPTSVMDVIDVISVRDGHMSAAVTVHVIVRFVDRMTIGLTLVVVRPVLPMDMPVVQIVDVVAMGNRDVSASLSVRVVMGQVFVVNGVRHGLSPSLVSAHGLTL